MGVVSNWLRKKKKKAGTPFVYKSHPVVLLLSLYPQLSFHLLSNIFYCVISFALASSFPFLSFPLHWICVLSSCHHLFPLASFSICFCWLPFLFFYLFLSFPFHWLPFLCFPFHWLSILSFGLFLSLASVSLHWLPFLFL